MPIPVSIITGCLGSGKTSLVKNLVTGESSLKLIIIQNELSEEMGIEAPMITGIPNSSVEFYELPNGCLCCSAKDGLVSALEAAVQVAGIKQVDGVVVETTGIADPQSLIGLFWTDRGQTEAELFLSNVVCLVNCKNILQILNGTLWKELQATIIKQICLSDVILLNHSDNLENSEIVKIQNYLQTLNQNAIYQRTLFSQISLNIFNIQTYQQDYQLQIHQSLHEKIPAIARGLINHILIKRENYIYSNIEYKIGKILWENTGTIFRCKGLFPNNDHWYSLQGVGDLFDIQQIPQDTKIDKTFSKILFIGINLNQSWIENILFNT